MCLQLSPYAESSVQRVCISDSTTLTCNSSASTDRMEWIIAFPESVEPMPITRRFSNKRNDTDIFQVPVNQNLIVTVFHILRRSDYNTTPLVTSLLIENVSADINGTNISCSISNSNSEDKQFMILVIDDNHRHGKLSQLKSQET